MNDKIVPGTEGLDAAVYLRKSRMEEGLATDEVLAKHQKTLYDYAAAHGIHILEEYPEVVSGESLYTRPQMLRLLQDVEEGKYDAVLCMDLDRLSRGRMKDQGIVLDAFRESGTLIITPEKIYNLADEIDEEYAELKTFISRREYKIITKRLRRGLQMSIQDGCYVANAPYGYHKTVVDRKPTLEIYEPEARFVRMMFELYAKGYGCVGPAMSTPWELIPTAPLSSPAPAWLRSCVILPTSEKSSGTRKSISARAPRATRSTSRSTSPGTSGPSPRGSTRPSWTVRSSTRSRRSWMAGISRRGTMALYAVPWPVWSSVSTAARICNVW